MHAPAYAPHDRFELSVPVAIRPCRREDLAALEWSGAFAHHREIIRDAFARHERDENVMLVADVGGFPAGQAWVDLARSRGQRVGVIWAVRVLPCLQGLGLGTRLVAAAEEVIARRGYGASELRVESWNVGARRLYERLGYAVVGRVSETYGYTPPDADRVELAIEEWLLRKPVGACAAGPVPP
jgi:ribosomal protein S18 acetylase RimI-like enzyme